MLRSDLLDMRLQSFPGTPSLWFVAFMQKACREIVRQYFYDMYETLEPCVAI